MDVIHEVQPRHRRRRANRERILSAAAEIVLAEGLDALSIKRVAEAADYTPGALYRYFPSKDALLSAVVVRFVDALARELSQASRQEDPLARVVAQCLAFRDFARRSPHVFGLLSRLLAEPRVWIEAPQEATAVAAAADRAMAPLAAALAEAEASGALRPGDARTRATLLWVGLQGALQLRKQERLTDGSLNADVLAGEMLTTLLLGFGADSGRVDALRAAGAAQP